MPRELKLRFESLKNDLKLFTQSTEEALESLSQQKSIDEGMIDALALSIEGLNRESEEIMRFDDDDLCEDMRIIQAVMQQPFYPDRNNRRKPLTMIDAALQAREGNKDELYTIVDTCARRFSHMETLLRDLKSIARDVDERIQNV